MQRLIMGATGLAVAAIVAGAAWLALSPQSDRPVSAFAVDVSGADIGGPFVLTRHDGVEVRSEEVFSGPTLVYFGYTFCPDICPVDVQVMADAVDRLAERGVEVTPVFVSIDPERDTPEQLEWFVEALHPRMTGLTGTPEAVKAAADAYKVFYSRVNLPESEADYLMNHTTFTYLVGPDGIAGLYRRGISPDEMADEVERTLTGRVTTS